MDGDVVRIDELVVEACGLLREAERGLARATELECLRARLADLAGRVGDREAAETACAVAHQLDDVLRGSEGSWVELAA